MLVASIYSEKLLSVCLKIGKNFLVQAHKQPFRCGFCLVTPSINFKLAFFNHWNCDETHKKPESSDCFLADRSVPKADTDE